MPRVRRKSNWHSPGSSRQPAPCWCAAAAASAPLGAKPVHRAVGHQHAAPRAQIGDLDHRQFLATHSVLCCHSASSASRAVPRRPCRPQRAPPFVTIRTLSVTPAAAVWQASQVALTPSAPSITGRAPSQRVAIEGRIVPDEPVPGQLFHRSDVARAVAAFHLAFGLPSRVLPSADVGDELAALRVRLLAEELGELRDATATRDMVGIADALADIVYVAYGTAVTYGLDLDAVLAEVHRANMSKLDVDGRPVLRADGKVLKSARYRAPDVARVLAQQLPLAYG